MVNVPAYTPGAIGLRGEYQPPNVLGASVAAYTLTPSDNGRFIVSLTASGLVLTVPPNLPFGFTCGAVQGGAGAITPTAGADVTLANRQSHTVSAGQEAIICIVSRGLESYVFGGDTA